MSGDNIEKLYQNYGILADAKDDISKVYFLTLTVFYFYVVHFNICMLLTV